MEIHGEPWLDKGSEIKRRKLTEVPGVKVREKGDQGDIIKCNTKETLLRKELEPLSKEDLIEMVIRLKEVRNIFETLPDEMIVLIFTFLPNATLGKTAQVSKRWCRLSYDPLLWKTACFECEETVKSGTVSHYLERGCQSLRIDYGSKMEHPILTGGSKNSYTLKDLDVSCSAEFVTENDFCSILSCCPELTKIRMDGGQVNDDMCQLFGKCTNLTELKFDNYRDVSCAGYLAIFTGCRRLKLFDPRCEGGDYNSVYPLEMMSSDELWKLVLEQPPSLTEISHFDCCVSLTDDHVELLVRTVPNMKALRFLDCPLLTGKAIKSISRLSKLTNLTASMCTRISNESFSDLVACKLLEELCVDSNDFTCEERKELRKLIPHCQVFF